MKIRAFLHLFSFAAILPLSLTAGKRDRGGRVSAVVHGRLLFSKNEKPKMTFNEIYHAALKLAEAAHRLAPGLLKYPHSADVGQLSAHDRASIHRRGVVLRDFAIEISETFKALSDETRQQIARS